MWSASQGYSSLDQWIQSKYIVICFKAYSIHVVNSIHQLALNFYKRREHKQWMHVQQTCCYSHIEEETKASLHMHIGSGLVYATPKL